MMQDDPGVAPTTIDVDREVGVTLGWADGLTIEIDLMSLRLSCPCADCRTLRERDQAPWPTPSSPTPLRIVDASLHGAWGLGVVWNDGHSTGIFPFDSLRETAERHLDDD